MTSPPLVALDREALRQHMADGASRMGIATWDLGITCGNDTSVQVDRGEPKQLKARQSTTAMVRVWNGQGLVGITSTNDLSPPGLTAALSGAQQASAFGDAQSPPRLSPQARDPLTPLHHQPRQPALPMQTLLERLLDAERQVLNSHPAISTVPYNGLAQAQRERLYINSAGALRRQSTTTASLWLYPRAEEAGRKPRSAGAVQLAPGVDALDLEGCIAEATERTISHLDYAPIDTGVYTVCFCPEAFLDLLWAFGSMVNAQAVLDGISLSQRNSLGSQVASPLLTVADDARHPRHVAAPEFDGEGTPTRRLPLIERGHLRHFLHSEGTARAFADGSVATGHANMGAKVTLSPQWLDVEGQRGDSSLSCESSSGVVFVDSLSALHAGVKASQGSFSLPFDGWLLSGGERRSIEAATVAGDIRSTLQRIVACEGDPQCTPSGRSPHIWVEGLTITGEA
ncbi:MAG: TldD/PmbA family protein [Synechococcus sp. SB0676_bin_10]|uniref:TldD/PmbA family protein n=1 Tax=Synechococcus sp. SB0676_bin_10 TaxID=2604869 RepID=A0A6B1FBY3_9SYNE|nr:TldD/PmbA family protein [Synechococcus sp. SB0664_bin_36]MYG38754.1 TldD/PmbA family protein [Synechococcus sp. SB0676_bin_10]